MMKIFLSKTVIKSFSTNPLSFGWLGAQTNTEGMGMKKIRKKLRLSVYTRANDPYDYLTAAFFNTYLTMKTNI